jgi:hypothetical protein
MKLFTQIIHGSAGIPGKGGAAIRRVASPQNRISQFRITDPVVKTFVTRYENQIPWKSMVPANRWTGDGEPQSQVNAAAAAMFDGLSGTIDPANADNTVYVGDIDIKAEFDALAGHPQYGQILATYRSNPAKMKEMLLSAVNSQKAENFQAWYKYLSDNYGDKMAFAYMAMRSVVDSSPSSRRDPPPALDAKVLADVYEKTWNGASGDIAKMYSAEYMAASAPSGQRVKGEGWVTIPSKAEDPDNYENNLKYLMVVGSAAKWCVGNRQWASKYLSGGKFDIYLEGGTPRIAVRYDKVRPVELQGYANESQQLIPYWKTVLEYSENTEDLSKLPEFRAVGEMAKFSGLIRSDPAAAAKSISEPSSINKVLTMAEVVAAEKDIPEEVRSATADKMQHTWSMNKGYGYYSDGIEFINSHFTGMMPADFRKGLADHVLERLSTRPSNYCRLNQRARKMLPANTLDTIGGETACLKMPQEFVECQELWEHAKDKPYFRTLLQKTVERLAHGNIDEDKAPAWLVKELEAEFDEINGAADGDEVDYDELSRAICRIAIAEFDDYTVASYISEYGELGEETIDRAMANSLASTSIDDSTDVPAFVFHDDKSLSGNLARAIAMAALRVGPDKVARTVLQSSLGKSVPLKFAIKSLSDAGIRYDFKSVADLVETILKRSSDHMGDAEAVASLDIPQADKLLHDVLSPAELERVLPAERRQAASGYMAPPPEHLQPELPNLGAGNWLDRYILSSVIRKKVR